MKKRRQILLALAAVLLLTGCGAKEEKKEETAAFTPRLDTEISENVEIAGFMGNFEALDQVINAFNEIYPNVVFTYDHNTSFMLDEYLTNNAATDIFMTDDANVQGNDQDYIVDQYCLDLAQEDIDVSAIQPELIRACTVDGKLLRLPLAVNTFGVVVNESLLKKEGLKVPENYEEFLDVLAALKEKGYTPLQGSQKFLYANLMENMAMNIIAENDSMVSQLQSGDEAAVELIQPVFDRLETIITNGYTDYELNCTFPEDNYDGSILAFFEGDMPFYVCNAECVSGMKKRESKSEAFSASPFDYEYLYAPLGDEGAYAYQQSWYGFSVNKDSDVKELAVEFLRFLMTEEQINQMASIKGLPSAFTSGADERYTGLKEAKNIQAEFTNDGSVPDKIRKTFEEVCNDFGAGVYANAEEAAKAFVKACEV